MDINNFEFNYISFKFENTKKNQGITNSQHMCLCAQVNLIFIRLKTKHTQFVGSFEDLKMVDLLISTHCPLKPN